MPFGWHFQPGEQTVLKTDGRIIVLLNQGRMIAWNIHGRLIGETWLAVSALSLLVPIYQTNDLYIGEY